MKKGDKKKQRKTLKRRTQSKLQRRIERIASSITPLRHIRQARDYPFEGCWIRKDWKESGLAVIVVARRQPNGNIVFGNYLVDYYCLGLKDTFCNAEIPPGEFRRDYLPRLFRDTQPVEISPALAHEIIYGAIGFAARYGFKPQRDYRDSQQVLDRPDKYPLSGAVEFGKDGRPFFISGPYDDADRIIRQLTRTAGEGNFDYMAMIGPPEDAFMDEIDNEDDFDEDQQSRRF